MYCSFLLVIFTAIDLYLEDVPDGHGGHVDHDQADIPVRQLLRRLREQQRPLLGEVRHACTKIFSNSRKIFVVSKLAELDQVSDVDPAHLLHRHLVPLIDQTVVGLNKPEGIQTFINHSAYRYYILLSLRYVCVERSYRQQSRIPPLISPLSAAVCAPGTRGEAVRAEVDSLQREESHHGLVVVPEQEDKRSTINFHKLDLLMKFLTESAPSPRSPYEESRSRHPP